MKATALLVTGNWQDARSIFDTLYSSLESSESDDERYVAMYAAARVHGIDGDDNLSAEFEKRASSLNCKRRLRRYFPTE
jgi:hypothetical protein